MIESEINNLRKHPGMIDIILDKKMYILIFEKLRQLEGLSSHDFLCGIFRAEADIHNLLMLKRLKCAGKDLNYLNHALLPGGKIKEKELLGHYEDTPDELENYIGIQIRNCRSCLARFWESTRYTAFGPEPLIFYLKRRMEESKLIRMIILGKLHNLTDEVIRKKAVETWPALLQ